MAACRPAWPLVDLEGGLRLGELLRDGRAMLLDFDAGAPLRALDGHWGDRVRYVAGSAVDQLGLRAVLVRPDGFVAWASEATPAIAALMRAAAGWFVAAQHSASDP